MCIIKSCYIPVWTGPQTKNTGQKDFVHKMSLCLDDLQFVSRKVIIFLAYRHEISDCSIKLFAYCL